MVNPGTGFTPNIDTTNPVEPETNKGLLVLPRQAGSWLGAPTLCLAAPPRLPHISVQPEHTHSCLSPSNTLLPARGLLGEHSAGPASPELWGRPLVGGLDPVPAAAE